MPAIPYLYGSTPRNISHFPEFLAHKLETYAPDSKVVRPEWHKFICNAGQLFLKNGKIARIVVDAFSAGLTVQMKGNGSSRPMGILLSGGGFCLPLLIILILGIHMD
jgi:hypothetical protein